MLSYRSCLIMPAVLGLALASTVEVKADFITGVTLDSFSSEYSSRRGGVSLLECLIEMKDSGSSPRKVCCSVRFQLRAVSALQSGASRRHG